MLRHVAAAPDFLLSLTCERRIDALPTARCRVRAPQAGTPGFTCLRTAADGEVRVTVSGELDIATAPELEDALRTAQRSATAVTLDINRLRFMDVRGLHVVLAAAAHARELEARFSVVHGPPTVNRLFELSATDTTIELTNTRAHLPFIDP
jgi:anti-sigma B factor antagonist